MSELFSKITANITRFAYEIKSYSDGPIKLKFGDYVDWLEVTLLNISAVDLSNLNHNMDKFLTVLTSLKTLVDEYRANSQSSTSTHANRMAKLCNQIDAIGSGHVSNGRIYTCNSTSPPLRFTSKLPDYDLLKEFVTTTRSKLKIIDESSALKKENSFSKKKSSGNKNDGNKRLQDGQYVRGEIKKLLGIIDTIESINTKNSTLLKYFGDIKNVVHRPIEEIIWKLSSLPNIEDEKKIIDQIYLSLAECEKAYNSIRSTHILIEAKKIAIEMEYIESVVAQMLTALKKKWESFDAKGNNEIMLKDFINLPLRNLLEVLTDSSIRETFQQSCQKLTTVSAGNRKNKETSVFDQELFFAYVEDWGARYFSLGKMIKSEDFIQSYERLLILRVQYRECLRSYEDTGNHFSFVCEKYRSLSDDLQLLKERFEEIALSELNEEINFTT